MATAIFAVHQNLSSSDVWASTCRGQAPDHAPCIHGLRDSSHSHPPNQNTDIFFSTDFVTFSEAVARQRSHPEAVAAAERRWHRRATTSVVVASRNRCGLYVTRLVVCNTE